MAKFETKYGFFTDDGTEYNIKNPMTPKPWVNVISNGNHGVIISTDVSRIYACLLFHYHENLRHQKMVPRTSSIIAMYQHRI